MKTVFKVALISLLALTATACSNTPINTTTEIQLPTVEPNLPQPPVLQNVNIKVYNADDLKQLIASNPNIVLFTMTPDQNEILGTNIIEMRRYILQIDKTVTYYHNLSTPTKNSH